MFGALSFTIFFSDRSSTGLHPLGLLAGMFFIFFSLFLCLSHVSSAFFALFFPFSSPAVVAMACIRCLGLWCASVVAIPQLFFFFSFWCVPGTWEIASSFASVIGLLSHCLFCFFSFSPLLLCFASG